MIGNLNAYTQFQTANAIPEAAAAGGGLAASAANMVMGVNMANQMAAGMQGANQQSPNAGAGMPPPLPKQAAYFAAIDGAQAGPFDISTLPQQVSAGKLTRDTLVWKQGMPQWTAAGNVPELKDLFANVPPATPAESVKSRPRRNTKEERSRCRFHG